jgi:hypothetical protein
MDIYILYKSPLQPTPSLLTRLAVYKLTFQDEYIWLLWNTLPARGNWFSTITLNQFRHGRKIQEDKVTGHFYLQFYGLKLKKNLTS